MGVLFLFGHVFHEPFSCPRHLRAAEYAKRKRADAHIVAALLRFALGETDAADFGIAVRAARHVVVVERSRLLTGDALCGNDPFGGRDVRELRMSRSAEGDDVADGGNAGHVCFVLRVDLDVALLHLQADAFGVETGRHRTATGRDEQIIRAQRLTAPAGELHIDVDAIRVRARAGDLRAGVARDALLLARFLDLGRHSVGFDRHQARQQLDDGHVAAETAKDRRELDADCAAAHDRDALRHLAQVDRLVARDDALAIDLDARHAARRRSGGDDNLLARAEGLLLPFEHVDSYRAPVAREPGGAFNPVD